MATLSQITARPGGQQGTEGGVASLQKLVSSSGGRSTHRAAA